MLIPDIVATKCRKCGANVSPGYDFCLSCGTKFSELPSIKKERDRIDLTKVVVFGLIVLAVLLWLFVFEGWKTVLNFFVND